MAILLIVEPETRHGDAKPVFAPDSLQQEDFAVELYLLAELAVLILIAL
jgi:hypothetical protein